MVRKDGGQQVIKTFQKDGKVLYVEAPHDVDPLAKTNGIVRAPEPVRSAVNLPTSGTEIYFFRDTRYVRVNAVTDTISYSTAKDIWAGWPALFQVGFATIDAVLPTADQPNNAYFFSGERCALIDIPADKVAEGGLPFRWIEKWSSLKDAGVERIDAVMPCFYLGAEGNNRAVFFSGSRCVTVDIKANKVVKGPEELAAALPFLADAGFKKVDAFAFKPQKSNKEGYFFSGANYLLVNLAEMRALYPPTEVVQAWSSLKSCEFY